MQYAYCINFSEGRFIVLIFHGIFCMHIEYALTNGLFRNQVTPQSRAVVAQAARPGHGIQAGLFGGPEAALCGAGTGI
ncbi:MAG: hypothetical protein ACREXG_08235, partial [Polaromonas sp.]